MADGKIKLSIDGFGRPRIEAIGFTGTACTQATAGIERALAGAEGAKVTVLKSEFYETETVENEQAATWS